MNIFTFSYETDKMTYMKALVVQEIGKPLVLVDRDIPQPGKGQVQLEVSVGGLNPHDQRSRDWGLLIAEIVCCSVVRSVFTHADPTS